MFSQRLARMGANALLVLALAASGAQAGSVTTVHDFAGAPGGSGPWSNLAFASDGFFYGTTWEGGAFGGGTFFRMNASGAVTTLHDFNPPVDGKNPSDAIHLGSDGYFYVITTSGGPGAVCNFLLRTSCGTLVRLDGQGGLTVLHSFDQMVGSNGAVPTGGVIEGPDGALYGAAENGGPSGQGLLYRYDPRTMQYSVLHTFDGVQGMSPGGPLFVGRDGRLWGTCFYANGSATDGGLVFAIDTAGNYQPIHYFNPAMGEGRNPNYGVVQAADGFFYGTTTYSGTSMLGFGTVFRMDTQGRVTTLRVFQDADGGQYPDSPLLIASDGSLYGVTDPNFDSSSLQVKGTIFRISPAVAVSTVGRLSAATGIQPHGGLVEGPGGVLYGTAWEGGAYNHGTVFRFVPGMQVESVVASVAMVVGGDATTGTVTLSQDAPAGGTAVALASSTTMLRVPASVLVAAGTRTATFSVTTSLVSANTVATITASANGSARSTNVTVLPMPHVVSVGSSRNPISSFDKATGTVTLSGPAPRAGAVIRITSSNMKVLSVITSVTVPGGMTKATFSIMAQDTNRSVQVTLGAVYAGRTVTSSVTVIPLPSVAGFTLTPTSVKGGTTVVGRVTLTSAAPEGGVWVAFKANITGVVVLPATVLVPSGANSVSISIPTLVQKSRRTVNVEAIFNGTKKSASLTVNP